LLAITYDDASPGETAGVPSKKYRVWSLQQVRSGVVFKKGAETVSTLPPAQERTGTSTWYHTDMLGATEQQALVTRLNRIEGQVRGIRRMVQEPRLCIEILQQLAAAEAALNRISLAIFKYHVDNCVTDGVARGEVERKKSLSELVDIFDRFAK
jgi:DNA-binding FrmR family transcriptional regulator